MFFSSITRRYALYSILLLCLGGLGPVRPAGATAEADRVAGRYATPATPGIPTVGGDTAAVLPTAQPAAGQSYSLAQSVARALAANPQMQSIRAAYAAIEDTRRQALANFGPVGTVSYSFQRTDSRVNANKSVTLPSGSVTYHALTGRWQNTYTLQLAATQPLFTGFNLLSSYQKAALNKDYAAANIQHTELTLIQAVQEAFLSLLQARANAQTEKDSVIRLSEQYKVAQAYYDEGIKAHLDMLQAEVDLATAEQSLLAAENTVRVQTAQLNTLLNLPLDQQTDYVGQLDYIPLSLSLDACLEQAYAKRPDLLMGVKTVAMAESSVRIAASTLYPQVQADATETWKGNQPDLRVKDLSGRTVPEEHTASVTASLQTWDSGATIFATRAARENVKKVQADLATLRLDAGTEVKTAYLNIVDAAKRIAVARVALETSREAYRSAVALYKDQVGTNADVLTAQYNLSAAETSLTQALTDYQTALSTLYVAIGTKNPSLAPQ